MWILTILTLLFTIYFSESNLCFANAAQEIHYSFGPACDKNKVICKNPSEVPTCLVLNPRVHVDDIEDENGNKINRFQPSCSAYEEDMFPTCVDVTQDNKPAFGVSLECVEFVKCEASKDENKLIPSCSGNKAPKCLGGNDEPSCETASICDGHSVPICDYIWQASAY